MAKMHCVNLNQPGGRITLDRLPRSDEEFHALHVVTRGLNALFAGEELPEEFVEFVVGSPQVLQRMPTAGKTQ
jgi:hypothetical protein